MAQNPIVHEKLTHFHEAFHPSFKSRVMDMSKLICEVWLDRPRGHTFRECIERGVDVKVALAACGIDWPEEFLTFSIDTGSFNGSIVMEEILSKGLNFKFVLPYAPCPPVQTLETSVIEDWINICDEWQTHPEQNFPRPPSPFIPLATS